MSDLDDDLEPPYGWRPAVDLLRTEIDDALKQTIEIGSAPPLRNEHRSTARPATRLLATAVCSSAHTTTERILSRSNAAGSATAA